MKTLAAFFTLLLVAGAADEPTTRCTDALCINFQQEVLLSHRHLHRDTDAACLNFQQYVPLNHQHVHRNRDATSPRFQEYEPSRRPRAR